jgi:hypothetical protein
LSDDEYQRDEDLARAIVRDGLGALEKAHDVVKEQIGRLCVLSQEEKEEFGTFKSRVEAYNGLKSPEHPLCLGVFGPPGSGKSFAVKELFKKMEYTLSVINLSQLQGPRELSAELAKTPTDTNGKVPVVFLDEFDSSLGGTPLGWLQWLLAPMQDGIIIHDDKTIKKKRAVYIFAGGTSDSFEEFPEAHAGRFRGAKGPDFISRLRGYINIRGVNEWPYRRVRRATVLRLAIQQVAEDLLDKKKSSSDEKQSISKDGMTDEFIDRIVSVGRFVHGSRSVEALVEMATRAHPKKFEPDDLRAREMLLSHVDAGLLGGSSIALSAGGDPRKNDAGDYDQSLEDVWPRVATRLLELGAALVYGGDLRRAGFTTRLAEAHVRLPKPLFDEEAADADPLARPRPGRVVCFQSEAGSETSMEPPFDRIDVRPLPGLLTTELTELGLASNAELTLVNPSAEPVSNWQTSPDWCKRLGRALALFRMRALITRLANAHLVFGGRRYGASGRFPGVAEEVMLGLAAQNAIYLCGGFGGAAHDVGELLGLGSPWFGIPDCLRREKHGGAATMETAVKAWAHRFQLPRHDDLPLDFEALVRFVRSCAVDGPHWPDNGLTADENRTLFRSKNAEEITRLVTKGLHRRSQRAT